MIPKQNIRTDLALEEKERFDSDQVEIKGVVLEEHYNEKTEIRMTRVEIETEKGAKSMGKPVGTYLTIEASNMPEPDEDYHREISKEISRCIGELFIKIKKKNNKNEMSILIVGLGNRKVTPDALGPLVIDNLCVNRHIIKEYGKYAMNLSTANSVSALVPGVMGQTGMETLEIVRGVSEETHPDVIVAIDALAARNSRRLNRTIQITDTGISPGSGVGNHRNGLNFTSLGVPVIAIGIPTVVDAVTIVNDTLENFVHALEKSKSLKSMGNILKSYTNTEKQELIRELIAPHLNGMYVTPKDIDDTMKQISYTLSESLNMLFKNKDYNI